MYRFCFCVIFLLDFELFRKCGIFGLLSLFNSCYIFRTVVAYDGWVYIYLCNQCLSSKKVVSYIPVL